MTQENIKKFLEQCSISGKKADFVLPNLAKKAKFYYIPTLSSDFYEIQRFVKFDDGKEYAVMFTDMDAAEKFCQSHSYMDSIHEVSAQEILKEVLKLKSINGVSINTNDKSQLVIDKKITRLLFREYLLQEFYMKGGAWCIFKNRNYIMYEVKKGIKSIPIFIEKEEAFRSQKMFKEKTTVEFLMWKDIIDFSFKAKLEYLIYAPDLPYATFLKYQCFNWIYDSLAVASSI
ncbi:hypothetical protein [Clostridium felsineum]|uniref:Uncharacterized protein n=1 Tax=Clostridium felsineum TaxID=36839 RepID=A0A1S8M9U6_9CLOT|nr:hypothetical protein [Clostridium felsineum]MCR3760254.1 hypothetical protein [Clostridium felsineum]URZ00512.1 hypothetical protein CLAUR_005000 [Clostridium felsineum]URZ06850.1 hypothetical protein CLROS_021830 [Clostridium felsineum]URZ11882.1 hypothetical protein CROST_025990 [Clostridium felsineum]URZ16407.1 hypothetical protein CLFE_024540 [Clostridium felsineum DSM 794]